MRRDLPLERIIEQTRLYVVDEALDRKAERRWSLKPEHDALYEYAIEHGLARWLTVTVRKRQRPPQALLDVVDDRLQRVRWWAANSGTRPAPDLLLIRTDAFENRWTNIRKAAEPEARAAAIWHDDPALFSRLPSGKFVCRAACVGHEGMAFYLAYDHETDWIAVLEQNGFNVHAHGRDAYLQIIRNPGRVAEAETSAV